MKDIKLGDLEETLLLLVGILGQDAYALRISEEYEVQTKKAISIGAVHGTLNRLIEKGFLTSEMGEATAERGGRRKRIYSITAVGDTALQDSKDFKMSLWKQYPTLSTGNLNFEF